MTTTPLHAALTERDGKSIVSLEGTPVATVDNEPKAIGMLCAEAIRIGRPIVVEVHQRRTRRYLAIDESGHATWTAGAVPETSPVDDDSAPRPVIPIARTTPGQAHTYAITSTAPVPAAPGTQRTARFGSGPLTKRGLVAVTAAVSLLALGGGGFLVQSGASTAADVRKQTEALRALDEPSPGQVSRLRDQVPDTIATAQVVAALREVASRHGVTVTALEEGKVTTSTRASAVGDLEVTMAPVTATLAGHVDDVRAVLVTELPASKPALQLEQLSSEPGDTVGVVTVTVTVTAHAVTLQ